MIALSLPAISACPPLDEVPIFTGFARAVLEDLVPGRAWGWDGAAHALHGYGMSLVWGPGVPKAFEAIADHLRTGAYRDKPEWLQIDPRFGHLDWDRALRAERFTRVNFQFDEALFRARHGKPSLPQGWSIRDLREGEYDIPTVAVSPVHFWKGYADFVAHGGGVCAVKNGEPGAIAFASTRFDDWLEIGIETLMPYRGMGLARAVAVVMIGKCLGEGLTPVWACRKENTGSLMLAQSLGFVVTKEVPFYRLGTI